MANARKCDRCGKCFDPLHMDGMMCRFRNPVFQTSNDIREGVAGRLLLNDPDAFVDLCPVCSELFEHFMCREVFIGKRKLKEENDETNKKDPSADFDGDDNDIFLPDLRKCLRGIWKDFVSEGDQDKREDLKE